jgi:hypothetical protein
MLRNNDLGYILGEFFTNSAGHPAQKSKAMGVLTWILQIIMQSSRGKRSTLRESCCSNFCSKVESELRNLKLLSDYNRFHVLCPYVIFTNQD